MDGPGDAPAFFVSVSSSETTVVSDGYTTTSVSTITTESIYFSRNLYARVFGGSTRITMGPQSLASLLRRYIATDIAQWSPTRRVVRAMDASGSAVVLKVFVPAEGSTVAYVAARKEATILAQLGGKHHIVPVLEMMDLPELDSYVLVMPLIPSEPAAIRASAATTRKCMRQLLEALQFVHTSGYLHLDVTPDNILYNPRTGSLTLIDFSHAMALSETPHDDVGGTRRYMAPEVLQLERPLIGPASDVWSAGAVLAEWICGRSVFKGDSNEEVLESILAAFPNEEFALDFWASEDAKSLLRLMLRLNAQERAAIPGGCARLGGDL